MLNGSMHYALLFFVLAMARDSKECFDYKFRKWKLQLEELEQNVQLLGI